MEFIFELLLELILEGSVSVSSNKRISKFIRYPIIFLLILFFVFITFGLMFLGILLMNKSVIASLLLIATGIFLLIGSILNFKKIYLDRR